MKVRMVITRVPYQSAKANPERPLSTDVRAWLTPGPIPDAYVEIVPDKKGGLVVREPERAERPEAA
jgi:hypothetical protein